MEEGDITSWWRHGKGKGMRELVNGCWLQPPWTPLMSLHCQHQHGHTCIIWYHDRIIGHSSTLWQRCQIWFHIWQLVWNNKRRQVSSKLTDSPVGGHNETRVRSRIFYDVPTYWLRIRYAPGLDCCQAPGFVPSVQQFEFANKQDGQDQQVNWSIARAYIAEYVGTYLIQS